MLRSVLLLTVFCSQSAFADDAEGRENHTSDLPELIERFVDDVHCFPRLTDSQKPILARGSKAADAVRSRLFYSPGDSWRKPVCMLYLLAMMGPDAREALPKLKELQQDERTHKYVLHFARTAEASIRDDIAELTRLATQEKDMGRVALYVLQHRGDRAAGSAGELVRYGSENRSQRRYVLAALKSISPSHFAELDALAETVASRK